MSAAIYSEQHGLSAGALALLVHGVFFSLLYFSFSWQMQSPQSMTVDIWDSLPSEYEEQVAISPPEKPLQQAEAAPQPAPAAAPPQKADIDLKEKKKKLKEEKLKLENSASKKLAEKRAEQAERRLEEVERQAQSRSQAQNKEQAEAAAASGKVVDEYIAKISAKIRRWIVLPPGVSERIKAEFNVTLLPSGEVLSANLAKSSGNEAYDNAVERAILKAQPLPLPPVEKNLFNKFRELHLKFTPAESGK